MFRPSRLSTIGCIAVLLAGCASYRPAPLSPAANAVALDSRTLDDPRLQHFVLASLSSNREALPGPVWDLNKLTLAALYYHPDLEVARAKLAVSRAGIITAGQRPNPSLNFSAVFASGAIPPGAVPLTIGPVVNFLIETFSKRQDRTAQARHLAEAAREDVATTAWQVRGRVRTALLDLWAAQRRLDLERRQIGLRQQLVSLLQERFTAGLATALDLTRERIALAQTSLAIRDMSRLEAEARVQLATAIGVPVRALDDVKLSVTGFDHPAPPPARMFTGALRHRALTERTDVQASLAQYAAAQSALQLEIANQYPNLTLGPGYNYDTGLNKFILSPTIDLPIFNQNQGQIAQAIANRRQAAANLTALQAQIIGAIDGAAAAYRTTTQSLATANSLLAAEDSRQRQVRASFAAGETDRPTLVTTELEQAVIRASQFDVLVLQRQALGALEDALQQPIFDPNAALFGPRAGPRTTTEPSS